MESTNTENSGSPAMTDPNGCDRCGRCCREGGPALHAEDLLLVTKDKAIDLSDLYTVRKGETAWDQPLGKFISLTEELVKIKSVPDGTACVFFNTQDNSCGIYQSRPLECRLLLCKNDQDLVNGYQEDRIARHHLLPQGHPIAELIREHDLACPAERIVQAAEELSATGNSKDIDFLAKAFSHDNDIRQATAGKAGLPLEAMDFFFGRPVSALVAQWGVVLSYGKKGSIKININK